MSPEAVAPDGSPVELYLQLPSFGEADIIHAAVPAGAAILELGCGTGRITRELVRLGHEVTAVDESAQMLAHVRDAETVQSRIEDLDLGRRFDAVLLASHFVNAADPAERRAVLEACTRHAGDDGSVIIQAYPADWHPTPGTTSGRGPITFTIAEAEWSGSVVVATVEYAIGDRRWRQGPFSAEVLDEPALARSLAAAGLAMDRWLDDAHTWLVARPSRA